MTEALQKAGFVALWQHDTSTSSTSVDEQGNQDAIGKAFEEGIAEGRRLAAESITARDAETLEEIAKQLRQSQADFATLNSSLVACAGIAVAQIANDFCGHLAAQSELETTAHLVRSFFQSSQKGMSSVIQLNPTSLERLQKRLLILAKEQGAEDLLSFEASPALNPGEVRVSWASGEISYTYDLLDKLIEDSIRQFNENITEQLT